MGPGGLGETGGGAALKRAPLAPVPSPPDNPVQLHYFTPPPDLCGYFGSLYVFRSDRPSYSDVTRADMAQLRFMAAGGGDYHFHDGHVQPTPDICFLGPTMGATRFQLASPAHVFGISVLPLGWLALNGGDVSQWTDRLRDVPDTEGDHRDLLTKLRGLEDAGDAPSLVWPMLRARLRPVADAMRQFVAATDAWLGDESSPRVDALVAATGLSDRQVARLTNRLYGGPPKLLARKYRALRCAGKLVIDHQPWQELCDDGTFYDQSHLIREIKHFIGLTPHQLMTQPTAVARLTLQRRELGGGVAEINRIS